MSNFLTNVTGRIDSDKDISKEKRDELVALAQVHMPHDQFQVWNADINGIIVQLRTNDAHLMDFWIENWFPAPLTSRPHGIIYAAVNVPDQNPYAYYNTESKTAIFLNTNYYGQCKSWALGIVADIMEMQHDIHSIHGAAVDVGGTGIVIIAPTGTGKSTHSYGLVLGLEAARMHSDDWIYVDYVGGESQHAKRASATISERKFYIRTDIARTYPRLTELLRRCKLENVKNDDFCAFKNSRAILDPLWIGGPEKFINTTRLRAVVLLRRDDDSPAEVELKANEAIEILRKGAYMVLPGGGPQEEWGRIKYEPFYNPYLLVRDEEREQLQIDFFNKLFEFASCHILNTGIETIEQSQTRIRRIVKEAAKKVHSESNFE